MLNKLTCADDLTEDRWLSIAWSVDPSVNRIRPCLNFAPDFMVEDKVFSHGVPIGPQFFETEEEAKEWRGHLNRFFDSMLAQWTEMVTDASAVDDAMESNICEDDDFILT